MILFIVFIILFIIAFITLLIYINNPWKHAHIVILSALIVMIISAFALMACGIWVNSVQDTYTEIVNPTEYVLSAQSLHVKADDGNVYVLDSFEDLYRWNEDSTRVLVLHYGITGRGDTSLANVTVQ